METVTTPGTDAQSGKTFTPEQVENIVKERLARDREARKDENATKAEQAEQKLAEAKAELDRATVQIETLKGTSATAEEITAKLKASHEKIVASIPQDKQKFIPDGLSQADQIAYITKNSELFFSTSQIQAPATVSPVLPNGNTDPEKFGGYKDLQQWAQYDAKGYIDAMKKGKISP